MKRTEKPTSPVKDAVAATRRVVVRVVTWTAVTVLALVAFTAGSLWWQAITPVDAQDQAEVEFTVPLGASAREVGRRLHAAGLVRSALAWRAWMMVKRPGTLKAGRHKVKRSMDAEAMVAALSGVPLSEDAPLTIVEGWRLRDTDAFLADAGLAPAGAYLAAASNVAGTAVGFPVPPGNFEGYLFPDTYRMPVGPVDVNALIRKQLDAFTERFFKPHEAEIKASGRTLQQLVIIASLVEREEPTPDMRPMVTHVMWKRLDAGVPLGIDATSRYTLPHWNDRRAFLKQLRDANDPYNTRQKPGLPPTPIGAPGLPALMAALRPKAHNDWYYLHDAQGQVHFGKDAKEHEANRRRFNVY